MDLIAHYNRQSRKPFERSISEHKFEDHRFHEQFPLEKGRIQENSYQQGMLIALSLIFLVSHMFHFPYSSLDSSRFEMDCAKDLRVNKESLANGSSHKIKEEIPLPPQRRFVLTPLKDYLIEMFCNFQILLHIL